MNLHKLSGKSGKTATNQSCLFRQDYLFGKKPLFPVPEEGADDVAAVAFINVRVVVHNAVPPVPVFIRGNDINVFFGGYLGIRNYGRREKCVGAVTAGTDDTADAQRKFSFRCF